MGRKRFDKKFGDAFLETVPASPGVYWWRDETGAMLYVGKAVHLRRRIAQYRNASRLKRGRKMRDLVQRAVTLEWEICASHLDACLREIRLIQEHRPPANVAGAYSHRYPYLALAQGPRDAIRVAFVTAPENAVDGQLFGAFRSRHVVIEAYLALVRLFRFVGHGSRAPGPRARGVYQHVFRRLPREAGEQWSRFFRGESRAALEDLTLRLLGNASARAKADAVQADIDALKRFWEEEAVPLRAVITATGYETYPVPQRERDPLFLRFRSDRLPADKAR
jgi:excinuclease UvrABC nuclease subunit